MQSRSTANLKGIDISNYQAGINMSDVAAQGIQVVMLKASEGEHTADPAFSDLYAKAEATGLSVGGYHFLHIGGGYDVNKEAEFFASQLAGKQFGCRAAIDIEEGGYHGGTPDEVTAQILAFADAVTAKTGVSCVVYSNTNFIKNHFTVAINKLPLWIADYNNSGAPGENGITDSWAGYQYSSSGSVGGCTVDMDEFTADILLNGAAQAASAAAPAGWTKDVYIAPALPYPVNAAAGRDFPVLNADGSAAPGHSVSGKDELIIAGVDYGRQLAEVYYPNYSAGHWIHGYIANDQAHIHDKWHYQWKNGSTPEITFDAEGNRVGSIDPGEKATPLYRKNGKLGLLYDTAKGMETKFGFVAYNGGFAGF